MNEQKPRKKLTKNALAHGVFASELLLPWESRKDLLELNRELRAEWDPQTRTEDETVLTLTRYFWLKHRNQRAAQIAALRDPFALRLAESEATTWSGIRAFLRELAKEESDAETPTSLMLMFITQSVRINLSELNKKDLEEGRRSRLIAEIEKLHAMMKRFMDLKATMEGQMKTPETAFHAAYNPEDIERTIRIDAMLDARIDKTISRLVSLREYRNISAQRNLRFGGTKQLPSPN